MRDLGKFLNYEVSPHSLKIEMETHQVHITFLEDDLVKVSFLKNQQYHLERTWSICPGLEELPPEGRKRISLEGFTCPRWKLERRENQLWLEGEKVQVKVCLEPFGINWYYNKELILKDRKTQPYLFGVKDERIFHYHELFEDEKFFGLGEKCGPLDKKGQSFEMKNLDAMGYDAEFTDPLYKHYPFYIRKREKSSVGIFYDNFSTSTFNLGKEIDNYHGAYTSYYASSGDLEYYLLFKERVLDITQLFSWLTGRTILPPRWSLGYSGSTMAYTDAPDAQKQLAHFVEQIEKYKLPCSSFQLSSGYTSIGDKRYVFHWNKSKIPEPKKMISKFHQAGIRVAANIKPVLLDDHPEYKNIKDLFIQSSFKESPEVSPFWDGSGSHLDFTNPETRKWWKEKVGESLLEFGVDSTWNDNNEYEVWDEEAKCNGFGSPIPIKYLRPIQPLLMVQSSYEAQVENNTNMRPWLISRCGMPGLQRYAQTWSGDNRTEWKTIRFNINMAINLSLSGMYNIGHDIGGFSGPKPEPELLLRWIQNGIFYPRFTIHSWNNDGSVTEPWMYPEIFPLIQKAFRLREKLKPYLYHLMYRAHMYYEPMIRPIFSIDEQDDQSYLDWGEFLLGENLLVASVIEAGVSQRTVYLPGDKFWYDFFTGRKYSPGRHEISVDESSIPLFVREGAIIATQNSEQLEFLTFLDDENKQRKFSFYDDDGETLNYKSGEFLKIDGEAKINSDRLCLELKSFNQYKPSHILFRDMVKNRLIEINGIEGSEVVV